MSIRLYQRPGSRVWYLRGTVRGRRVFETTGTTDRKQAEFYRAAREAKLYEASVFGERAVVSYTRAALSYLEDGKTEPNAYTKARVAALVDHFGSRTLAEITGVNAQRELDDAITKIVGGKAAPATKNRMVRTPHVAILNHAARRGWCGLPLLERKKEPRGKTRWLTPTEAKQLVDSAAPHLRPLLIFFLCTGARVSEALELDWCDVDLLAAKVVLRDTKNGTDRPTLLPPAAVAALASLEGERSGRVFRRDDGEPYTDREREEGGQIKTAFATACRRAGLTDPVLGPDSRPMKDENGNEIHRPNLTPHALRHTWASWFYAVTKDLKLLQAEGGWLTLRMVERYSHLVPSALVPEIGAMWGGSHPRIGAILVQAVFTMPKTA